jgi:hypothetical protein
MYQRKTRDERKAWRLYAAAALSRRGMTATQAADHADDMVRAERERFGEFEDHEWGL